MITQNVDDLHERAGSTEVLHGAVADRYAAQIAIGAHTQAIEKYHAEVQSEVGSKLLHHGVMDGSWKRIP